MAGAVEAAGLKSVAKLAESPGVRECLQSFTRDKQWINEQHLRVCRIPAPTFLERARAEWMAEQFCALGCTVQIDVAGNVIARPEQYSSGPVVALTAHLDTVLAPRNPEEITVGAGGRLFGPGVSDNGSGLAALLAVARALKNSPKIEGLRSGLVLVANVGEEGEGNLVGMRYLCQQSPLARDLRAFLVLDGPAMDHITTQALECRRFEVTFSGPGGHSWSDFGAGNPVHALGRAVAFFTENRPGTGSTGGRTSFNFGLIEGGSSVNSIPTLARAKLDIRSESAQKMDELVSQLWASVNRAAEIENERASASKVVAKVREIGARPGGALPEDAPILCYLRAVDAHLGIRSRPDCASTDANIPLAMGLPAVSIGAGGRGGGAHTPAEWYHPDGRDLGLKRILLTLCLLMGEPEIDGAGG